MLQRLPLCARPDMRLVLSGRPGECGRLEETDGDPEPWAC